MQVQRYPRLVKRVPCAIHVGERRYTGLVINLSQGGLFVQTHASAGRGSPVDLELNAPGEGEGITLQGTVAWRKVVPGQLQQLSAGGFGLEIENADERYYQALARWMRVEGGSSGVEMETGTDPDPDLPTWRVRVRASTGPRTRTLSLEAASSEEAREAALGHIGGDWRVIEIEAL